MTAADDARNEAVSDAQSEVSSGDSDSRPSEADTPVPNANPSPRRRASLWAAVAMVAGVGCLTGWLGYQAHQTHAQSQQRRLYLQTARQAALNLTTISYTEVDADVQRILDSTTGVFHDDFQRRSQPFVDVVKQSQSTSVGTVTEAGLESTDGNGAQALLSVSVKTSRSATGKEPQPHSWRMRIGVQKVGGEVKVASVQFVP